MEARCNEEEERLRKRIEELKRLIAEEEEALEKLKVKKPQGITEEEIERQCDKMFGTRPLDFYPRNGNALEERMSELIIVHDIRVPVAHIRNNLYLLGS